MTSNFESGGSPITSYRVEWDNGTGMNIWTPLVGYLSPYIGLDWTQLGTVDGKVYYFRLRA